MHKLETGREVIRPLITEMDYHLSVHALADGAMPGWVYVDDLARPDSAFAFNNEGWYLIGDARNRPFNAWFRSFLRDEVLPDARAHQESIPLHFHPADWQQALEDILAGLSHKLDYQHYFRFTGPDFDWRQSLPADCTLRPVDARLLSDREPEPISRLIAWAQGGFGSLEAFFKAGLGMCLEKDGRIVSWCMPDCATGDRCELGVHTVQSERRRGLAAVTVAAAIEGCLANGFTGIGWHCWSENEASARLAQKVGFSKVLKHPAFWIST